MNWTWILNDFENHLRDYCTNRGISVKLWEGVDDNQGNIFEISTHPKPTLLYVKVRSEGKGFWGLNPNRIDALKSSGDPWSAVLLLGSSGEGYLVYDAAALILIGLETWKPAQDSEYKINQTPQLDNEFLFTSFNDLLERVFS